MTMTEPKTLVTAASEHELVARMENVSRLFDGSALANGSILVRALANVSFLVTRGEVVGLLGPRGAGKSTILRILAGRLGASEGKVKVFGRSPRRGRIQRRIGYLYDDADGGRGRFLKQLIGFLRDVVGLSQKSDRTAHAEADTAVLRRSRLTRMLLKNPELVLLDEPFSGLDPDGCQEMKEVIDALAHAGKTVILTGDSLCHTKDICNRLVLLCAGRVEFNGPLGQALETPEAVRFLGQLLPPPTAERVLQVLREDLLVASAEGGKPEVAKEQALQPYRASPADRVLGALLQAAPVESGSSTRVEARPEVNHDLLSALTKAPAADSRAGLKTIERP